MLHEHQKHTIKLVTYAQIKSRNFSQSKWQPKHSHSEML